MNIITVVPRIISNDLVKYYRNALQFIVEVLGDDSLPAKAGENVSFNINGVFYTKQTDELGVAKMNINLPAGNYTVTTEYKGCKAANNIVVLTLKSPILSKF